jgi:hypothetical protein
MTQSEPTKQPFFARFMESQNKQTSNEEGQNPSLNTEENYEDAMTLKFPSDKDEGDWLM